MAKYAIVEVVFHDEKKWTEEFNTNEEAKEALEKYTAFLGGVAKKIIMKAKPD